MNMKTSIVLCTALIAFWSRPATAALPCAEALAQVTAAWTSALGERPSSRADSAGPETHPHTPAELAYVRDRLREAALLCQAGKDHQALLQLDIIRAWLGLPAIAHPPTHPPSPETLDDE